MIDSQVVFEKKAGGTGRVSLEAHSDRGMAGASKEDASGCMLAMARIRMLQSRGG
jgi:hypothetical protein